MNCKFLAYILSQYLWVILLGLCLISTIQFKKPIPTGDIYSNSNAPYFNRSKDPTWFLHFTDIHISSVKDNYMTILTRFNRSLSLFSPDHIVITGDIADNYRGTTNPTYYQQTEADWNLYKKLLSDLDNYFNSGSASKDFVSDQNLYKMDFLKNPLHVAGNHDIFNILSFDSKKHYANGILYNESNYIASRVNFDENISFVKINPFTFPSPPTSIIWWISPTSKIRNEISNLLQNTNSQEEQQTNKRFTSTNNLSELQQNTPDLLQQTIMLGHIPSRMWFSSFSSTLSNTNNNVRIYLCGHLHPEKPRILHHGKAIEIVGTPLFRYNEIGILASDNGHFSYHQMNLDDKKFAILTFPNPDTMRSSNERFDEPLETTEIRAISFSPHMNLSFKIDNGRTERLDCKKQLKRSPVTSPHQPFSNDIFLCTKKPTLRKSDTQSTKHTFTKLGDWSGNFTFTVGQKIDSFNEECYFDEPSGSFIACFFLYLVFLIIVALPFGFVQFADRFDDWLELELRPNKTYSLNSNSDNVVLNGNLNWMLATVGGFFVVHRRVSTAPLYLRIVLIVAVLWSFVFPFCFFEIEGKTAAYWLWGYLLGSKSFFMATPTRFGCYYLVFVVAPFVIVVSGLQHTFGLFAPTQKKSQGGKSQKLNEADQQLNEKLNNSIDINNNNGVGGVGSGGLKKDESFTSSEQIIGIGFDLRTVDKLTLFKRGCMIMNCFDLLLYFSCFYKCYVYAKELAKDFGDVFGYLSFIFVVIPAVLFVVLVAWVVTTSARINKHRFDFTISSLPLEKAEL